MSRDKCYSSAQETSHCMPRESRGHHAEVVIASAHHYDHQGYDNLARAGSAGPAVPKWCCPVQTHWPRRISQKRQTSTCPSTPNASSMSRLTAVLEKGRMLPIRVGTIWQVAHARLQRAQPWSSTSCGLAGLKVHNWPVGIKLLVRSFPSAKARSDR